jgi:DNA sulfur modification protein DndD
MEVLSAYKTRLQEAKTQSLAATMTKCFKQIASKQNLISEIQINAQSLDFVYLDSDGNPTNRTSFSAGEKQLLVIAMLWALGICSKKKFPVIIDTPLARLDNAHRETLIKNYFPKASDQTILLSTDTEVYGKYYDLIRTYVDKEFTLAYNDEAKQTVIQDGYFEGEAI